MSILQFILYIILIIFIHFGFVGITLICCITYYRCSVIDTLGHKIRYEINVKQVKSKD